MSLCILDVFLKEELFLCLHYSCLNLLPNYLEIPIVCTTGHYGCSVSDLVIPSIPHLEKKSVATENLKVIE